MKTIQIVVSLLAFGGVLVPSVLYFVDTINLAQVQLLTLVSTVAWFLVTPFWMGLKATTTSGPEGEA